MTRWLQAAKSATAPRAAAPTPSTTDKGVLSVVSVSSNVKAAKPKTPEAIPHRQTVAGFPCTWTGRVVSLADWRALSDWERHGPNGRHWNGLTREWEEP